MSKETQTLVFTIPVSEPLPSQYLIRCMADRWVGSDQQIPLSFQHLILPEQHAIHTGEQIGLKSVEIFLFSETH